jgi:lipopolysaccharide export system protein LptA
MSVWRFVSASVLLLWGGVVAAAPPLDSPSTASGNIIITSQSLIFKNQENTAFFEGKVVMKKTGFIMNSDQMTVYFEGSSQSTAKPVKPPPKPIGSQELPTFGNRAVSVIEATGNVIINQGGKKSKSKKAFYYQQEEKLVLTGDPEVWEEGYRVTGVKMTMFLREDRSIVEGGSRVVINEAGPTAK